MFSRSSLSLGAFLVTTILVAGCNDRTPTGPSTLPDVTPPAPAPRVIGTWNLTVRATESVGEGKQCVIDTLKADVNTHNQYSLSIVQTGDITDVTLASASGDYACTFHPPLDDSGFATNGHGYYECAREQRVVSCDGTEHTLTTFGQDISGRFSGNDVSGEWSVFWVDMIDNEEAFSMKAQFTGSK